MKSGSDNCLKSPLTTAWPSKWGAGLVTAAERRLLEVDKDLEATETTAFTLLSKFVLKIGLAWNNQKLLIKFQIIIKQ